jgi:translation initiation factor 2B subunit (eIF-2B alpha/beta/delta family)
LIIQWVSPVTVTKTQFEDPSSQPGIQVVLDELRLVRELMRRAEDGRQAMAIELQQIRREQIEFKTALESIQAQQYNMTSTTASLNNIAQQVLRRIDKLNETMVGNMANYANNITVSFRDSLRRENNRRQRHRQ